MREGLSGVRGGGRIPGCRVGKVTVHPGGPARDEDHAGHRGRCVLEVGGER